MSIDETETWRQRAMEASRALAQAEARLRAAGDGEGAHLAHQAAHAALGEACG